MKALALVEFNYGTVFTPEEQELIKRIGICANDISFDDNGTLNYGYQKILFFHEDTALLNKYTVIKVIKKPGFESLDVSSIAPVNQRCNVAVAGLGLLAINEVIVETDFCTERLQIRLSEGWHILAICVQPDQRRPDYILGRTLE